MASRVRSFNEAPVHVGMRAGVIDLPSMLPNARSDPPGQVGKRHEVFGLLCLSASVLLALALAAYDSRGGHNWCGPIGATVAESLVVLIGTASVLVPWSLFVLAIRLFRRSVRPLSFFRAAGTLSIIAAVATALHLALDERLVLGHLAVGGLVGESLGEILRTFLGSAGADVVVMTVLLVALVLRTRLSVVSIASTARHASVRSSLAAKDGIATVAKAWKQARDEEQRVRTEAELEAMPRIVLPETRTASALAPVFASAHDTPFDDDSVDLDPTDSQPGETRAGLLALLGQEPAEIPIALTAVKQKSAAAGGAAAATEGVKTAPRRTKKPAVAPASASVAPAESTPDPIAPFEPVAADAPAENLQIVSHDEEIQAAMRSPPTTAVEPVAATSTPDRSPRAMVIPSTGLLTASPRDAVYFDENQLRAAAERLIKTLKDYTIEGRVVEIHPGPVVTTYEFVPAAGTKLSKIARLSDDIAMSLEATTVRIVAPIPGKGRVGFEIPNAKRQMVHFREMMETDAFQSLAGALPVAFGKDVVGAPYFADLATMPHLIVAGSTGSGKSVGLNVMLTSLLYKRQPEDVRLLMIDPKQVELAVYDGIPHMLLPVVTDMKKAALALRWVVDEMERRYALFAQTGSRNITTFNERVTRALLDGKPLKGLAGAVRTKVTGTTTEAGDQAAEAAPVPAKLPYILVVVDEFADLMMVAGKEVESAVARLAQKARASGIHVILATQRPSVDVITGVIKANFPSRVAFKVSQKVDSRTILDQQGAEHLLGKGDMLILPPGSSDLRRVHCAYVSEDDVQAVTDHWRKQGEPTYDEEILRPRDDEEDVDQPEIKVPMEKYEKAVALVLSSRRCSVSWVQRQLAVGYNVAARMVEKMERDGIVGAPKGPGKDREVLG